MGQSLVQAFFQCAPEKKLKGKKLNNSETQGKKLKLKQKTSLFGIFVEFFQKIGENNEFFFTICKKTRKVAHFDQKLNEKLKTQGFF